MASSAGASGHGPKQDMSVNAKSAKLGVSHSRVEGEASSGHDGGEGGTRPPAIGKKATSAFEIIAVEMQDSDSSADNSNLHNSRSSLGCNTNDTDQEQDINGNAASSEDGMAADSETENTTEFSDSSSTQMVPVNGVGNHTPQNIVIEFSGLPNGAAPSNADGKSQRNSVKSPTQAQPPQPQPSTTPQPPISVPLVSSSALPYTSISVAAPAPSVSTIKTQTGREITILKVEAEFRRGRWACSDYHDHRDTSPPPPNPSPATGVTMQLNAGQTLIIQQQSTQPQGVPPLHNLPAIVEQHQQRQNAMSLALQQPPPQSQTNYSTSTQQMVEKTAAALSRALSTDPSGYPTAPGGTLTSFSGGQNNAGVAAPVSVQSQSTSTTTSGGSTGALLSSGQPSIASLGAIEVKVTQALDLVKKYLMAAVRHELVAMQSEVTSLQKRLDTVQQENQVLRAHVSEEVLQNLLLRNVLPEGTLQPDGQTVPLVAPSSPSLVSPSANASSTVRQPQYYNHQRDQSPTTSIDASSTSDQLSSAGEVFQDATTKRQTDRAEKSAQI